MYNSTTILKLTEQNSRNLKKIHIQDRHTETISRNICILLAVKETSNLQEEF
jgi:hypothetical protein